MLYSLALVFPPDSFVCFPYIVSGLSSNCINHVTLVLGVPSLTLQLHTCTIVHPPSSFSWPAPLSHSRCLSRLKFFFFLDRTRSGDKQGLSERASKNVGTVLFLEPRSVAARQTRLSKYQQQQQIKCEEIISPLCSHCLPIVRLPCRPLVEQRLTAQYYKDKALFWSWGLLFQVLPYSLFVQSDLLSD